MVVKNNFIGMREFFNKYSFSLISIFAIITSNVIIGK